jgi:hypothetical protein
MPLYTLEERLRILLARITAAEMQAQRTEEYAERTNRIYHSLYEKHSARLDALERKGSGE